MISKRVLYLMLAFSVLVFVCGAAAAFAAESSSNTYRFQFDDGNLGQSGTTFADASELATPGGSSAADPRKVYRVEDLENYGSFGVDPSALQAFNSSDWITAGDCTYKQQDDDPHWSSQSISVHGWWIKAFDSTCPTYANVDTYLQGYWCPFGVNCQYVAVAEDSRDVKEGGGRGRRGNARHGCSSTTPVSYRGALDVDLIDQSDPSGLTYSKVKVLNCYPAGQDG